jgi:hypothetical protein
MEYLMIHEPIVLARWRKPLSKSGIDIFQQFDNKGFGGIEDWGK